MDEIFSFDDQRDINECFQLFNRETESFFSSDMHKHHIKNFVSSTYVLGLNLFSLCGAGILKIDSFSANNSTITLLEKNGVAHILQITS